LVDKSSWFPFGFGGESAARRLFCLPFAGGGASFFLPWRKNLNKVSVVPVQYPGRETRLNEPCHQDLGRLVDELAIALAPHLDHPYSLLGYSLGAKIGFALCHRLAELGLPLPELFIPAAHGAPDSKPSTPGAAILPDDEFIEHIRRYGGVPELVFQDPELRQMMLPILRADIGLVEHPVPDLPLSCPILAYAGNEDLAAQATSMQDWRRFAGVSFSLRIFQGGHFFARTAADFLPTLERDLARIA
jgi:medium-chain acyl-[acyl-carrier-protein] hydrolase